ncbi:MULTISPECIES: hypothetical protein [unclassified Microbacterium]|uniref:hypothetical protein n=1 Tax=unclassified Microbacterium TaxID=2609290 RepID=UPI00386B6EAA
MSGAEAGELCTAFHKAEPLSADEKQTGTAVALARYDRPEWYVYVPAENANGAFYQECVVGGTAADPRWVMTGQALVDGFEANIEEMRSMDFEAE